MPYIGNTAANRFVASKAASVFSGDGSTTAFTLDHGVGSDEDILVSVDGVIQEPSVAYSVSGTTLTFTAAPSSNAGNNIFVYYLFRTVGTVSHPSSNALEATSGTFTGEVTTTRETGGYLFNTSGSTRAGIRSDDQNNLTLRAGTDAIKMQVGADGNVTMPSQSAFLVRPTSNQSNIAVGSDVTIVMGTEIFDQNGDFASNTFTAPVTGKYRFDYGIRLQDVDTASSYYISKIVTSNREYTFIFDSDESNSDLEYLGLSNSVLADMDAGDTAILKIYQDAGSAQTDINANNTKFSGNLVC